SYHQCDLASEAEGVLDYRQACDCDTAAGCSEPSGCLCVYRQRVLGGCDTRSRKRVGKRLGRRNAKERNETGTRGRILASEGGSLRPTVRVGYREIAICSLLFWINTCDGILSSSELSSMRDARVNQYPEANRSDADWAVAVFAHNEADNIERCLNSIRGHASRRIHAYVLANGCSDETESVVRSYAERNDWVSLVSIARGDKCNAWNVFVHEVAPAAQIHFFMDGDVWAEAGAFDALGDALSSDTRAMAAAAAPSTGRAKAFMEELVCTHRLLLGNLYALRGTFVQAARQ